MSYAAHEALGGKPAELFLFTQGATSWAWTSGDSVITKAAVDYLPAVIRRANIEANNEAHTGNCDVIVPADNPVARLFGSHQPDVPVFLTIFRRQLDDVANEFVTLFAGQVRACTFTPDVGTLHCGPMQDVVQRKLAVLSYQLSCNNALFDDRCQVDRPTFTYTHDIVDVIPAGPSLLPGSPWLPPRYMLDAAAEALFVGALENILLGGVAQIGDQRQTIIGHAGNGIYLLQPLRDVFLDDTLTLTAGCLKTVAACRDSFSNLVRFNGFPHIPQRNPFEGSGGLS